MIYNPTCILIVVVGWWLVVCNQWYIWICVHELTPTSGVHMNSASDCSCKNEIVLVICSCIFWQIAVLQGWQMPMLLDKQMSIFPVWQMATYPKWQMQILTNCFYVVAHGSCKTTVCVEGMQKSCSTHFPLASWEAVGLHTGVLTKTFTMSVLYLKTIDVFSKENRLISLYIKREKRKFVQTISFIQSHCEFIFIWSRIRDTVLNPKKLFPAAVEAACRAGVVVIILWDTVVEVFKVS